jgi:TRAP-type mannitol/chloroaromatic compound transport system substrate-binding protein
MAGWFRREIREVADLQGLKFRVGGFAARVLQKLGVVPQQTAGSEIGAALASGSIDAAEWVAPYDDEKMELHKAARFYYYPGWWEGGAVVHHFINLEQWSRLPKAYQSILRSACDSAGVGLTARYDAGNAAALRWPPARSCGRSRSRCWMPA